MHTLRYVSTSVCGRMKNSAITLVYAEYATVRSYYVVIRRRDPKILCLHKKSSAYANVLLIR